MRLTATLCALMALMGVSAFADPTATATPAATARPRPTATEPPAIWSGDVGLSISASNSSSNSNSSDSIAGSLTWQPVTCTNTGPVSRYKVSLKAGEYKTVNEHETTSQEVDASLRVEATVYRHLRGYGAEVYYRDPFTGIQHQYATEVGGLLQAVKNDRMSLDLSLAVAPTWQDRASDHHRFIGGTWGTNFSFEVDDTITIQELFSYSHDFSDPRNWAIKSYTELNVLIYKRMFGLKASYWTGIKGEQLAAGQRRRTSYLNIGGTFEFPAKPKK